MASLLTNLLTPVVDLLWEKLEPKFDELADKVLALLPLLAASAAKGAVNEVLENDPDIPGVSDIFDLSETIRNVVNGGTPVGIHIPGLGDLAELFNRQPYSRDVDL